MAKITALEAFPNYEDYKNLGKLAYAAAIAIWLASLLGFQTQANDLRDEVVSLADTVNTQSEQVSIDATDSANSALMAKGSANFAGDWAASRVVDGVTLNGYILGQSTYIDGNFYVCSVTHDVAQNPTSTTGFWRVSNTSNSGYKNLIINGGFDIWHRGDIVSGGTVDYGADRWLNLGSSQIQERVNSGNITGCEITRSIGTTTARHIGQGVELNKFNINSKFKIGNTYTLTFWTESDTPTSGIVNTRYGAGFSDSGTGLLGVTVVPISDTTDIGTGLVKHEFRLTVNSLPQVGATALWVQVGVTYSVAQDLTVKARVYDVRLEPGSVSRELGQRHIGLELPLCRRYLPYRSEIGDAFTIHGFGYGFNATTIFIKLDTKVSARIAASSVAYTGNFLVKGGGISLVVTSMSIYANGTNTDCITLLCTVASGGVASQVYQLINDNDDTAYIQVETEL